MKKIWLSLGWVLALGLQACDLQPKIMSLPDSVGEFISARYPALLADPVTQPEIYNSAATDYGVYASPELYGAVTTDDYVLYASVSDYIIPPQTDEVVVDTPVADGATPVVADTDEAVDSDVVADVPTDDVIVVNDDVDASPDVPTDDYLIVPMYGAPDKDATDSANSEITVAKGDTLYSLARRHGTTVENLAKINKLQAPYTLRVGQTLQIKAPTATYVAVPAKPASAAPVAKNKTVAVPAPQVVIKNPQPTTTRVELQEITVGPGDTLYSISRKYSVPVNDLAVMNNLSAPFGLYAGQRIKVPNLDAPSVRVATQVKLTKQASGAAKKSSSIVVRPAKVVTPAPVVTPKPKVVAQPKKAVTSKPSQKVAKKDAKPSQPKPSQQKSTKAKSATAKSVVKKAPAKTPKIAARSSSKFSWPVRGRVLSGYGPKSTGLVNDGINISATRGTAVRAAENGVVAYAGNEVKGMGNLVIIQHSGGWMTVYAHMGSMSVRRGSRVNVGQKIGTVGTTGKVSKPQLHFEIRKGTKAYNPISYLKK